MVESNFSIDPNVVWRTTSGFNVVIGTAGVLSNIMALMPQTYTYLEGIIVCIISKWQNLIFPLIPM